MDTNEKQLIPLGPMARRLRVPAKWLKAEAQAGRVPHLRADTAYLFNPEAVQMALVDRAKELHHA